MKSRFIYIGLFLAICVSMYFTYERSFVTRDFDVMNSEEEVVEEEEEVVSEETIAPEEEILETESNATEE